MLRWVYVALLGGLCFSVIPAYGQLYHIYRPLPVTYSEKTGNISVPSRLAVSAAPLVSLGKITDGEGEWVSSVMAGGRLQGLSVLSEWVSAGIEGSLSYAADQQSAVITSLYKYTVSGIFQWTLTPDTNPELYLHISAGAAYYRSHFIGRFYPAWGHWGFVGAVGAGSAWKISPQTHINMEYRLVYEPSAWNTFVFKSPVWFPEFSAGLKCYF